MNTYKLELNDNDLRELSLALQERPYKSVAAVIVKIGEQVQRQLDATPEADEIASGQPE